MSKEKKRECDRYFREIRRTAAQFAWRADFSPRIVKAIEKSEYASGDGFVCACVGFPKGTEAANRIAKAQILSAFVYADALHSKRVRFFFDDLETICKIYCNEVLLSLTFDIKTPEAK